LLPYGDIRAGTASPMWIIPQMAAALLAIWAVVYARDLDNGKRDRPIDGRVARPDGAFDRMVRLVAMETVWPQVGQGILRMARVVQAWHTGRLRLNLIWVVASLLLVLGILLGSGR
jgi:hypothetical protein